MTGLSKLVGTEAIRFNCDGDCGDALTSHFPCRDLADSGIAKFRRQVLGDRENQPHAKSGILCLGHDLSKRRQRECDTWAAAHEEVIRIDTQVRGANPLAFTVSTANSQRAVARGDLNRDARIVSNLYCTYYVDVVGFDVSDTDVARGAFNGDKPLLRGARQHYER